MAKSLGWGSFPEKRKLMAPTENIVSIGNKENTTELGLMVSGWI